MFVTDSEKGNLESDRSSLPLSLTESCRSDFKSNTENINFMDLKGLQGAREKKA